MKLQQFKKPNFTFLRQRILKENTQLTQDLRSTATPCLLILKRNNYFNIYRTLKGLYHKYDLPPEQAFSMVQKKHARQQSPGFSKHWDRDGWDLACKEGRCCCGLVNRTAGLVVQI